MKWIQLWSAHDRTIIFLEIYNYYFMLFLVKKACKFQCYRKISKIL